MKNILRYILSRAFLYSFAVITVTTVSLPVAAETTEGERQDKRIVAVLFSVGQTEDARARFRDISNLDLLDINGKPMIMRVYEAVRASKYIQKIVIVAAPEVAEKLDVKDDPMTSFLIDQGDAAKNVQFGVGEVSKGDLIMFIPSDLVLATTEGIDNLIEHVLNETKVDVVFPLISRRECERKYPEEARTYGHFREGQYTGAHVEFLRPDLFLEHVNEVKAQKSNLYNLYYMRKNTLGAARFLGVKLTLKYIFGTLSVRDIEQHVYEKYQVTAKAVFWDDADLATDLSEPADIQMISRTLQRRAETHSQFPTERPLSGDRS